MVLVQAISVAFAESSRDDRHEQLVRFVRETSGCQVVVLFIEASQHVGCESPRKVVRLHMHIQLHTMIRLPNAYLK